MKIPASFKDELTKRKRQEEKEQLKEMKKEEAYQQRLRKHEEYEQSKLEEKREICKALFSWKEEFLRTDEGAKMFKRAGKHLWVFNGRWAHELPRYGGHGCWSRIYFNPKNIEYWPGYKWMPYQRMYFATPEEMAKALDYTYLKEFLTAIETGKIFKYILEFNKD
jgi:hypothetical protein